MPLSRTLTIAPVVRRASARRRSARPVSVYFAALLSRLANTCVRRTGSPRDVTGSRRQRRRASWWPAVSSTGRLVSTAARTIDGEVDRLAAHLDQAAGDARDSSRSSTRRTRWLIWRSITAPRRWPPRIVLRRDSFSSCTAVQQRRQRIAQLVAERGQELVLALVGERAALLGRARARRGARGSDTAARARAARCAPRSAASPPASAARAASRCRASAPPRSTRPSRRPGGSAPGPAGPTTAAAAPSTAASAASCAGDERFFGQAARPPAPARELAQQVARTCCRPRARCRRARAASRRDRRVPAVGARISTRSIAAGVAGRHAAVSVRGRRLARRRPARRSARRGTRAAARRPMMRPSSSRNSRMRPLVLAAALLHHRDRLPHLAPRLEVAQQDHRVGEVAGVDRRVSSGCRSAPAARRSGSSPRPAGPDTSAARAAGSSGTAPRASRSGSRSGCR